MEYYVLSYKSFSSLPAKVDTDGYVIVPGLIPQALIAPAVSAIKERVGIALKGYGMEPGSDCENLIKATASLGKSPVDWPGMPFGGRDKRGWMKTSGTGRIFDDWRDASVVAVQEECRVLAAALFQVPPDSLHRVHERCSIKVPGCPAFGAHVDRNRRKTFQMIVALSDTKVLLWPGSHQHDIGTGDGYYALTSSEIKALPQPGIEVDVGAGDVCVMKGGELVHGSIKVTSGARIMTYAHFELPPKPRKRGKKAKQKLDEKAKLRKQLLNFPTIRRQRARRGAKK